MKPKCKLTGQDGNIFNLIGIVAKTLKNEGEEEKAYKMIQEITLSKSYDEALKVIMEYVEIE